MLLIFAFQNSRRRSQTEQIVENLEHIYVHKLMINIIDISILYVWQTAISAFWIIRWVTR